MRLTIPLLLMLLIASTNIFAQESKHRGLHELIQQALSGNPQILAARARYEAARARVAFFRNFPDPRLGVWVR